MAFPEGCSWDSEFEAEIAELVRTHPGSTSEALSPGNNLWSSLDRPNLSSFPKMMMPDPHMKEPAEGTPQRALSLSALGGFPQGWGQQSGPVFSIVKLCGECVRGFMFQCVLWVVQQWRGRIEAESILTTLFQILLCFSFSLNETVVYTYVVV